MSHPRSPALFYISTPIIYTSTEKASFWGSIVFRISPARRVVSVRPPARFGTPNRGVASGVRYQRAGSKQQTEASLALKLAPNLWAY